MNVTAITLDGAPVDLAGVLADVVIRHGRVDAFDEPSSSAAQITLIGVTRAFVRSVDTGARLVVSTESGPRFTGRVTDCALDVDRLTLLATSTLATLSDYVIGAGDWPAETWSARVTRLFSEAGLAALLELAVAPLNPVLAARPGDPVTLFDALADYAKMLDAGVVDRPNGNVFVQPLSARTYTGKIMLDPDTIEYAPGWTQVLPEANIVTVKYAGGEVTVRADESVALYGPRAVTLDSTFVDVTDATRRANERLTRGAYPHWNVPAAPVLAGADFPIGRMVELTAMPPASPYDPWAPLVEGWTDQIVGIGGDLDWRMELSLSDPLASGLTLPWDAVPAGDTWSNINQTVVWKDALTLDSLEN